MSNADGAMSNPISQNVVCFRKNINSTIDAIIGKNIESQAILNYIYCY